MLTMYNVDDFTFESLVGVLQKGTAMLNDIEEYLRKFNISHGRFSILLTLYSRLNGRFKPSELAQVLGKKKPTITGMLKKLVKDGYVQEIPDPDDLRSKCVKISNEGYKLLGEIIPDYNNRIIEIGKNLTDQEKKELKRLVDKINI